MRQKVFVGVSGGVDSAVSAALLAREGHEVAGVFIKIWQPEFLECTWQRDRIDAMRVCAHLGIPFREIDLSDVYKKEVVDGMLASYSLGETPNPDVLCNKSVKFGAFLQWALKEGAGRVATGHYAQVRRAGEAQELLRGADTGKDQSYFLHRLNQEQLGRALFPVGKYTKPQVRALARRFALPVAQRPDSQGLCFVGDVSMGDFLGRFMTLEKGEVHDRGGRRLGEHDGAARYTIGQRHGFRINGEEGRQTHYVVAIDTAKNVLTVSRERADAEVKSAPLRDLHWIGEEALARQVLAQSRYREQPFGARVDREGKSASATFDGPQLVSPGQSLVLYDGERCLGGGVLSRSG